MAIELNLHLQRCDKRWECKKHDRVPQTPFGLGEALGNVLCVFGSEEECTHGVELLLTPLAVLMFTSWSTIKCTGWLPLEWNPARRCPLESNLKHSGCKWVFGQKPLCAVQWWAWVGYTADWEVSYPKSTYTVQEVGAPLMGCCTSLELGQSKSPLKRVQGGCQVCSTKGFALQTCSHLSPAFANVNTTSDATSTCSWQVPIPFLSPEFPCPEKPDMEDPALQKTRFTQKRTS